MDYVANTLRSDISCQPLCLLTTAAMAGKLLSQSL